jgi:hypothetical protein
MSDDEDDLYIVEAIVGSRIARNGKTGRLEVQFRAKYLGYSSRDNTWENVEILGIDHARLVDYLEANNIPARAVYNVQEYRGYLRQIKRAREVDIKDESTTKKQRTATKTVKSEPIRTNPDLKEEPSGPASTVADDSSEDDSDASPAAPPPPLALDRPIRLVIKGGKRNAGTLYFDIPANTTLREVLTMNPNCPRNRIVMYASETEQVNAVMSSDMPILNNLNTQ